MKSFKDYMCERKIPVAGAVWQIVLVQDADGSLDAAVREWQQLIVSGALQRPLSLPCPARLSRLIVWSNHTQAEIMPALEVSHVG